MAVQRQMRTVNGKIAVECSLYLPVVVLSQGNGCIPEDTVVTDQTIDLCCNCLLKRDLTRIDRGSNFGNRAIILNLQPVIRARKVLDYTLACVGVAEFYNFE